MNIDLIGVPTTYGCGKNGAQYGPDKLREFGLYDILSVNHRVLDTGDVNIPRLREDFIENETIYVEPLIKIFETLAHTTYLSLANGHFPIVIGGDHSISIGSIAGASRAAEELAVVWIDAHGDINTFDTSPTLNIHGMPLATSMGYGYPKLTEIYFKERKVDPKNVYHIGGRDIDPGEWDLINQLDLDFYTMEKIEELKLENIVNTILDDIKNSTATNVHLSFDIDCLDSSLVPGTGTPVSNGLTMEQGKYILEKFLKSGLVTSMDFVELNPLLDNDEITITNCVELINHISNSLK